MHTTTAPMASTQRLIAKVLRDLVSTETFASYADLKDALRRRLARLRIRYPQADFDDAISVIASNVALVDAPPPSLPHDRPVHAAAVDRQTARDLVARLGLVPMIRTIGDGDHSTHEMRLRAQVADVHRDAYRSERRLHPLRERLDAIFQDQP